MDGYVYGAGDADTYEWRGARVALLATGARTRGQLAVMEFSYPVGLAIPAHVHDGEDEMFYLLDGELEIFCDDTQWTITPGDFVFVPRDHPHGFTVVGDRPARTLVVTGPPRLDASILANGTPV